MQKAIKWTCASTVLVFAVSCGSKPQQDEPQDNDHNSSDVVPINPGGSLPNGGTNEIPPIGPRNPDRKNEVIKARWMIDMKNLDESSQELTLTDANQLLASTHGTSNQPISGTVAMATSFTVSNASFSTPTTPTGVASYGSLNVTTLSDNALRVCGANNNSKCTKATIRMYTTGTAGGGLWSDVEAAGLPITSGTSTVGLGAANAAIVGQATIGAGQRTVRLANFTTSTSLAIPVSVDFTDAAAGTYSSTLVVEYVLE